MKENQMEAGSNIQHDLRREFHNIIGILKIIKHENALQDEELKSMIELCLERESDVTQRFEELTVLMEKICD
jgi:hypothetical protein